MIHMKKYLLTNVLSAGRIQDIPAELSPVPALPGGNLHWFDASHPG